MRGIIPCKDREQWLKMRHKYLGEPIYNASELSVYVGDNPYKSAHQAWLEKTEQKEREDLSENPNIQRGIEREPFIRQHFIQENEHWLKFKYKPYDIYIWQNEKYTIGATLDSEAEVYAENKYNLPIGAHVILECKSVLETPQTYNGGQWVENPPIHYVEQQYGQLMATGYTADFLCAEFDEETEKGEHRYTYQTYDPVIVDQKNLLSDPNVKALDSRLTVFAQCVKNNKAPDKNVQGVDAEITFKADIVSLGSFEENVEEVKEAVALAVQSFKNLEVSADNEKEGKEAKAKLNKVRKSIEEKRLEVCRQWDEPKNIFNAKCKEVVGIVDEAIKSIDDQLKVIEDNRIAGKKTVINALISSITDGEIHGTSLTDYFEQCGGIVYDSRWENRTYAKSAIEKDIIAQVDQFKADFSSMSTFSNDSELYNAMLMAYKRTRRLSDALQAKTELENAREIARRAQEERAQQKFAEPTPESPEPVENPIMERHTMPNSEQLYTIGFDVFHVTKSQLAELSTYLKSRGISFKRTSVTREN